MPHKLILLLLLFTANVKAQVNLVQNGSFEDMYSCPNGYYQIEKAKHWFALNKNYIQNWTTDYFSACAPNNINVPNSPYGGGAAPDGSSYLGFYLYNKMLDTAGIKNYAQNELVNPLKPNTWYCFKMQITLGDPSSYAVNDISVYFSLNQITDTINTEVSYLTPQITNTTGQYFQNKNGWDEYTGYFKASGGEKYMIIGGFLPTDSPPKIIVLGGQFDAAYYMIDDVQLVECGDSLNTAIIENNIDSKFKIYPNPTTGTLTIEVKGELTKMRFELYDALGNTVYTQPITGNITTLTLPAIPNGIYNVRLYNSDEVIKHDKLVIIK